MKTILSAKVSFFALAILLFLVGTATIIDKIQGTNTTQECVHEHFWLIGWVLMLTFGLYAVIKNLRGSLAVLLLHLSFAWMLMGACLTQICSVSGTLHVRMKQPTEVFYDSDLQKQSLPFSIQLDSFRITPYPGTTTPANYTSYLTLSDKKNEKKRHIKASMNQVAQYKGYRFFQSAYDPDGEGSVLKVSKDVWGTAITYTAYVVLGISMILVLFSRKTHFFRLIHHPLLKRNALMLLVALLCFKANAETLTADSLTLSNEQAKNFGRVLVLYNGRICPIQTLAIDFTLKMTGKRHYTNLTAEQFFFGWLFFPERWASKLTTEDHQPRRKSILASSERTNLINMLHSGSLFQIFPVNVSAETHWLSASDRFPTEIGTADSLFIRQSLVMYRTYLLNNCPEEALSMVHKIETYQKNKAGIALPPAWKLTTERLYNYLDILSRLWVFNLIGGTFALTILIFILFKSKKRPRFFKITPVFLLISLFALTIGLTMRCLITGHLPFGSGYESMIAVAWFMMAIGLLFGRKSRIMPVSTLFMSGIFLLVAHWGWMNPPITPLKPVLNSFWLNLHVSLIVLAYALASILFISATVVFILKAITTEQNRPIVYEHIERITLLSRILLYPCVFFMGTGIFLGAVWANVSWGRYWGWDPKETWALITFLIYSVLLHIEIFPILKRTFWFHFFAFIAFFFVLMTFFGVNFILGGMHSYIES